MGRCRMYLLSITVTEDELNLTGPMNDPCNKSRTAGTNDRSAATKCSRGLHFDNLAGTERNLLLSHDALAMTYGIQVLAAEGDDWV